MELDHKHRCNRLSVWFQCYTIFSLWTSLECYVLFKLLNLKLDICLIILSNSKTTLQAKWMLKSLLKEKPARCKYTVWVTGFYVRHNDRDRFWCIIEGSLVFLSAYMGSIFSVLSRSLWIQTETLHLHPPQHPLRPRRQVKESSAPLLQSCCRTTWPQYEVPSFFYL